jgi:hypothetical protein
LEKTNVDPSGLDPRLSQLVGSKPSDVFRSVKLSNNNPINAPINDLDADVSREAEGSLGRIKT